MLRHGLTKVRNPGRHSMAPIKELNAEEEWYHMSLRDVITRIVCTSFRTPK